MQRLEVDTLKELNIHLQIKVQNDMMEGISPLGTLSNIIGECTWVHGLEKIRTTNRLYAIYLLVLEMR